MNLFELLKKHEKKEISGPPEYIVACLGNPGKKYALTRHNAGFMVADYIADKYHIPTWRTRFDSLCSDFTLGGKKVMIIKPQTMMNNSGVAVREAADFYKIPPENVIVIFDDVNIQPGSIRIKRNGSDGGHNGIKSIIYHLSSDSFPRIKIGIGKPEHPDMIDWVIGEMSKNDLEIMFDSLGNASDALDIMINKNIDVAMAKYNKK